MSTLPCPYILFPSSLNTSYLKLRGGGETKDELMDRTHTHIVSFIVLDMDIYPKCFQCLMDVSDNGRAHSQPATIHERVTSASRWWRRCGRLGKYIVGNNVPSLLGRSDSGEVSVRRCQCQWSAVSPAGQSLFYRIVSESEHPHFSTPSTQLTSPRARVCPSLMISQP